MTPRHRDIYEFIQGYIAENGHSPTYRTIAAGIGLASMGRVSTLLADMKKRGLIDFEPYRQHSIRLLVTDAAEDPAMIRRRALEDAANVAKRFGTPGRRAARAILELVDQGAPA